MGYNSTERLITSPVGIYDVKTCLANDSNDLATLCMANNINMWSARKPISNTKVTELTANDWKGLGRTLSDYKTGSGIKKKIITGSVYLQSCGSNGLIASDIWTHDKPLLGESAFRLTDFNTYKHNAGRSFYIGTIFGNINNIIIPSSDNDGGMTLGFSIGLNIATYQIPSSELFGDCTAFYAGVIMCAGSGNQQLHYVKTAANAMSQYIGSGNMSISITINTRDFMNQMKADWSGTGTPYNKYPFRKGDPWTACLVLIDRSFSGGDGAQHKLNGTEKIVRLEYAEPMDNVYVDRRTLPMKPSKYNTIEWMKLKVKIQRYTSDRSGFDCYKITSIIVTAKMLATDSITFSVNAVLSAVNGSGIVVIPGQQGSGGVSVTVNSYIGPVTFSGTVGEVQKEFTLGSTQGNSIPETTYYISQSATSGNKLCNANFTFVNSSTSDSFSSQFSFDISTGPLEKENELL